MKEVKESWVGSLVQCDICTHIWVAVFEVHCDYLECPHCHSMTHYDIINENLRT